jgi:hypothetical protein
MEKITAFPTMDRLFDRNRSQSFSVFLLIYAFPMAGRVFFCIFKNELNTAAHPTMEARAGT